MPLGLRFLALGLSSPKLKRAALFPSLLSFRLSSLRYSPPLESVRSTRCRGSSTTAFPAPAAALRPAPSASLSLSPRRRRPFPHSTERPTSHFRLANILTNRRSPSPSSHTSSRRLPPRPRPPSPGLPPPSALPTPPTFWASVRHATSPFSTAVLALSPSAEARGPRRHCAPVLPPPPHGRVRSILRVQERAERFCTAPLRSPREPRGGGDWPPPPPQKRA